MTRGGAVAVCVWLAFLASSTPADEASESAAARLGVQLQSGTPMKITSDELEMDRAEGGAEQVIFQQNVRVEQGDLLVYCDWLEALYLEGASGQADRITARGSVRILQTGREAFCTEAVFDNVGQTVECTSEGGQSRLRRSEDIIIADRIHFDLKTGKFRATGAVQVEVRSEEEAE
jgi:lipopolysaccharide transport protein LptA